MSSDLTDAQPLGGWSLARRRLGLARGDGAVGTAENAGVGLHRGATVGDRGPAVSAPLPDDPGATSRSLGAAPAAEDLAVEPHHAGRRDERRCAAGAGFVDRKLVSEVQTLHDHSGSRRHAASRGRFVESAPTSAPEVPKCVLTTTENRAC
jgi:hypothetical protein